MRPCTRILSGRELPNADRIQRGAAVQFETNEPWDVAQFAVQTVLNTNVTLSLPVVGLSSSLPLHASPATAELLPPQQSFFRYSRMSEGFEIRGGRFCVIITTTTANT